MADTPDPKASAEAQGAGTPNPTAPAAGETPTPQEIRAQVLAEVAAQLKAATGHDSIDALAAAQAKAAADKLAEEGQFKQLAEQAQAELAQVKSAYQSERIRGAIVAAAAESIDPDTVHALLASQAQVAADGAVTIAGKPVTEAVRALLATKPHLARAAGSQGSGSGGAGAGGGSGAPPKRADFASAIEYTKAAAKHAAQQGG